MISWALHQTVLPLKAQSYHYINYENDFIQLSWSCVPDFPSTFVFWTTPLANRSRDSVVSIATTYGQDDRGVGVRVPVGSRIFSSPNRPDRLWGPPNLLSNEYQGLFSLGVKQPGREVDHSPPTSAKVKKMWIFTFTPHTPSWRSA
jgi:hypothetical protein